MYWPCALFSRLASHSLIFKILSQVIWWSFGRGSIPSTMTFFTFGLCFKFSMIEAMVPCIKDLGVVSTSLVPMRMMMFSSMFTFLFITL